MWPCLFSLEESCLLVGLVAALVTEQAKFSAPQLLVVEIRQGHSLANLDGFRAAWTNTFEKKSIPDEANIWYGTQCVYNFLLLLPLPPIGDCSEGN